jgi:hypothetical protein
VRAGIASGLRKAALPAGYQIPEFADPESIIGFARELGRLALTADVDMRRLAEARGAATLALKITERFGVCLRAPSGSRWLQLPRPEPLVCALASRGVFASRGVLRLRRHR